MAVRIRSDQGFDGGSAGRLEQLVPEPYQRHPCSVSASAFSRRVCGATPAVINPAATAASTCRLTVPLVSASRSATACWLSGPGCASTQRLLTAHHLAFVFPVWWEATPAATEAFLDRVLTKGVMFDELAGAKGNPSATG